MKQVVQGGIARAAIYARYSSDLQRDASIEDQVRLCRDRIEREGWSLAATYTDHAISGANRLRPGYQRLLEDARAGAFNTLVAEALDRLSRDQEDIAALFKHLAFAGVRIVTITEGEITELHVGLKGTMNALYLKDLAVKTRRGLEGRIRQHRSAGGLSYGYEVVRVVDANGERIRGERRINIAEAHVVQRIFREFASGRSPRQIARKLNAEGVPGPGGRRWCDTTIRGHHIRRTGILHNDLYAGRLVWNKQRYVKDPTTGKRLARPNPESAWISVEVPELRIVDEDLWSRVAERLGAVRHSERVQKAMSKRFWEHRRARHLLTGIVQCGVCGSLTASVGKFYIGCSAARRQGTCSNRRSIPRPKLENLILAALKRDLMQPPLVAEFIRAFHAEINRHRDTQEAVMKARRKDLADVSRRLDSLIEAIADGLRNPGLQAKLDELESRKAQLETELANTAVPAPRLHPNLAELYRRKVEALHEALADPDLRDEAFGVIRSLIERIVLLPTDNGLEIELVGDIASMIAIAGNPKISAAAPAGTAAEQYTRSVKVVAGACNRRYLQLHEQRLWWLRELHPPSTQCPSAIIPDRP